MERHSVEYCEKCRRQTCFVNGRCENCTLGFCFMPVGGTVIYNREDGD